jgi:hypothetical protein
VSCFVCPLRFKGRNPVPSPCSPRLDLDKPRAKTTLRIAEQLAFRWGLMKDLNSLGSPECGFYPAALCSPWGGSLPLPTCIYLCKDTRTVFADSPALPQSPPLPPPSSAPWRVPAGPIPGTLSSEAGAGWGDRPTSLQEIPAVPQLPWAPFSCNEEAQPL